MFCASFLASTIAISSSVNPYNSYTSSSICRSVAEIRAGANYAPALSLRTLIYPSA
jgi:hypothetical protein